MKMNTKGFLLLFLCAILSSTAICQIIEQADADKVVKGSKLIRLDEHSKHIKYIKLAENYLKAKPIETEWLSKTLRTSKKHSFKVIKSETDREGFNHTKYQVFYNNVPVEGLVYSTHSLNGLLNSANGEFLLGQDISVKPPLKESDAFEKAKAYVNAKHFLWETSGSSRPIGKLTILPVDSIYVLAYKFDIYAIEPLSRQYIFVNANTGEILKAINRIHISNSIGTAKTMYNGTVSITTDSYNGWYRLRENGRGNGIETYNLNHRTNRNNATDFTDADNNWTDTTYYNHAANDAHYATEATYDYYFSKFGRNSYDNKGAKIKSYVHYGNNYVNAFWDGSSMTYGDGDGITYLPLTPIEVVAHEITHGVTEHSANLIYHGESGALNESFSDIFGIVIDFFKNPLTANYLMGDAMSVDHTPFRSMQSPNAYGDPDTYNGLYWYTGAGDGGGVHTNSGVQNFWFYLLAEGGTGTNDIGSSYNVTGIGREKAAQIAYRNLTVYLTESSNYADARFYSIQAAIDLFGECSPEVIAVSNAWYAVGVGNQYNNRVTANFITSKIDGCSVPSTIRFYNRSSNALNYLWNFGDGTTDTTRNPTHTFTNTGNYNVKLISIGNTLCNSSDTVIQSINISQTQPLVDPTCMPSSLNTDVGGIYSFQFNTINKLSNGSADNYQDYSCSDTTTVTEGRKYKISAQVGVTNPENVYVWADLNNNGTFNDAGELIYQRIKVSKYFTDSIIFPVGTIYNVPLRLRIGTDYVAYPLVDACTDSRYGQYEDYALAVKHNTSAPEVMFSINKKNVVSGDTVQFRDNSLNVPTSWSWSFSGGTPATSTLQNPRISYDTPGTYDVILSASNNNGTNSITKTGYIVVTTPAPVGLSASIKNPITGEVHIKWNTASEDNVNEDFEDGVADNFVYSHPCFSVENGYLKASGAGDGIVKCAQYERDFQDFILEYKFQQVSGSEGKAQGTFIRSSGFINMKNESGYLIEVVPNGSYSIWKFTDGNYINIIPWSTSTAINTTPEAWNIVTIEASGSLIKLFINSQYVVEFDDASYASGKINLFSYFGEGYNYDIRWDYMNIITSEEAIKSLNLPKATNIIIPGFGDYKSPPKHNFNQNVVEAKGLLSQLSNIKSINVFNHYNIYRDSVLLKTAAEPYSTDTLPKYGTYKYQVTSLYDEGESASTNVAIVKWEEPNPGENCLNAQNLMNITSPYSSSTSGYNSDFNFCNINSPDRIFYIDVPSGGLLKIGQTSNDFDSRHSLRVGGSCPGTTEIVCVDEPDIQMHTYENTSDTTERVYFIEAGYFGNYGNFTLAWDMQIPAIPVANFSANQSMSIPGSTIDFSDISRGIPTSWKWYFSGGSPATSTLQNPSVTFSELGEYDVKLVVFNSFGTDSMSKTGFITVSNLNYCKDYLGGGGCPGDITAIGIKGTSLNNIAHINCGESNGSTYGSYPANGNTTATLQANSSYELSITTSSSDIISVWIDFDQSGTFDPSEWTQVATNSLPGIANKALINIPINALSGKTGMRIRTKAAGSENGPYNACTIFYSGITEDYCVTINNLTRPSNFSAFIKNGLTGNAELKWTYENSEESKFTFIKFKIYRNGVVFDSTLNTTYTDMLSAYGDYTYKVKAIYFEGESASTDSITIRWYGDPKITVTPMEFNETMMKGNTVTRNMTVSNNGDGKLIFDIISKFKLIIYTSLITDTLNQGESVDIQVTFDAKNIPANDYADTLVITSTDIGTPIVKVPCALKILGKPTAYFSSNYTNIAEKATVQFTNLTTGGATQYKWMLFGGTPSVSFDKNPLVAYKKAGTYNVTLIGTNEFGSDTLTINGYITVLALLDGDKCLNAIDLNLITSPYSGTTVGYEADFSFCSLGNSPDRVFYLDVPVGKILEIGQTTNNFDSRHSLRIGGDCPGTTELFCTDDPDEQIVKYLNTTGETQRVYFILGGYSSWSGNFTLAWKLTVPLAPVATFSSDLINTSTGRSVNYFDNSQNYPASREWTFTGGIPSSSTLVNPTVVYSKPGVYDVKLVVSNAGGADSITKDGYITISEIPKPVANFNALTTNTTTTSTVSFYDNSAHNPTSWKWSFQGGDPATSTYSNPNVNYNKPGVYSVTLVVSNAGGTDTITKEGYITVTLPPKPGADFGASPTTVNVGNSVYFYDNSTNYPNSWKWVFSGGLPAISSYNSPTVTYNSAGIFNVKLVVSNAGGSDSITKEQYITVVSSNPAPTGGDNCSDAMDLALLTSPISGSTTGYNSDFSFCSLGSSPDRIFYIDVPMGSTLSIGQTTNDFDSRHTIRVGGICPGTTELVCIDDPDEQSYTYNNVTKVTQRVYYIIGGFSANYGNFKLAWKLSSPGKPKAEFLANTTKIQYDNYVYFTDQSLGMPTSWKWHFSGGSPSETTDSNPSVYYSTPGKYSVKLIVANSQGNDTIIKTDYITVSPPPKPVASFYAYPTNAEVGSYINYQNESYNNFTSQRWTFEGGEPSTSTYYYPSVKYNTPGLYTVKLVVSNVVGSDSIIKSQYITIAPSTKPLANFYASNTTIVLGSYINFDDNSGNSPTEWKWTFSGGNPSESSARNPYVYYYNQGTYPVKLVVSNSAGVDSIVKIGYITVTLPPKPLVDFYTNNTTIEAGNYVNFNDYSSNSPTARKWSFPGGSPSTSTDNYPYVIYNTPGIYDVKLVAYNVGGCDSLTKLAYINVVAPPKPVADFYVNQSNIYLGNTIQFYNTCSNNPSSLKWAFAGGTPSTSTDSYPSVTYNSPGKFAVKLVASNAGGTDSTVKINYISVLPTDINDIKSNKTISLFPNPVTDILNIVSDNEMIVNSIEIRNVLGSLVLKILPVSKKGKQYFVDMSKEVAGYYTVLLYTDDGLIACKITKMD